jgi:hypothetical protein
MKQNSTSWQVLAGAVILLSLCSAGQAEDQVAGQVGNLNVSAKIEPFMAVSVTLTQTVQESGRPGGTPGRPGQIDPGDDALGIEFSALEKPGVIDADKDVLLSVASNITGWNVTCSSQGLSGSDGTIPADRIFVKSDYTNPAVDAGVGPGYESLSAPRVVAAGSGAGEVTHPASFKLNVTWEDKPGSYNGVLTFTVLPEP